MACSAPSGGSLLQRVSSPSQERHRQAQVRVHGCEVNPSPTRSWSPSTKLLVRCDFKRDCLSPRNSRQFFGRELTVAESGWASQFVFTDVSKSRAGSAVFSHSPCDMWRQESQDVHQHRQTSLFAQTPDGRYLGRGRATSTCGSNPSTVRARNS